MSKKAEKRPAAPRQRTPVDTVGLVLLFAGVGCLQFVLERGHAEDWFDSKAITICLIVGILSLISLIVWEVKGAKHPILELRHFKNPTFRSGVMLMFALGGILYGLVFMVPIFTTMVTNLTATQIGELFIPGALASAAMMPFIGANLRKHDPRYFIAVGIVLTVLAASMISQFDLYTSTQGMFWPLLLRGAAMAWLFVPINSTVLSQFSGAAIGQAAGLLNLCRQIGGSVGIAILATLFQRFQVTSYTQMLSHVTPFDPAAQTTFMQMTHAMASKFSSATGLGVAMEEARKLLYFQVSRQAFVLAFQKVMLLVVSLFSLSVIPMWLMRVEKPEAPKPTGTSAPLDSPH